MNIDLRDTKVVAYLHRKAADIVIRHLRGEYLHEMYPENLPDGMLHLKESELMEFADYMQDRLGVQFSVTLEWCIVNGSVGRLPVLALEW